MVYRTERNYENLNKGMAPLQIRALVVHCRA